MKQLLLAGLLYVKFQNKIIITVCICFDVTNGLHRNNSRVTGEKKEKGLLRKIRNKNIIFIVKKCEPRDKSTTLIISRRKSFFPNIHARKIIRSFQFVIQKVGNFNLFILAMENRIMGLFSGTKYFIRTNQCLK